MATRFTGRIPRTAEMDQRTSVGPVDGARRAITGHRRFTLHEVTLGGLPVGGATVDVWHDSGGAGRWSARLLIPVAHPLRAGVLAGTAAGGRRLSGVVHLGETTAGPRRGREVLVEFHGDGQLSVEDPRPLEDQTSARFEPA